MSLLLDALKRAEQEKLSRQGEASNDAAPAQPASKGAGLELQPLSSAAASGPSAASAARTDDGAHAAQVMFDAKAAPADAKRGRGMLWATFGAIAVVVAGAAAYVWNQIRLLSPQPAPMAARRAPPPPLPLVPTASVPSTVAPLDPPPRMPATVTITSDPVPASPAPAASAPRAAASAPAPEDVLSRLLRDAPAAPAPAPLTLTRSAEPPAIPANVASGYSALRSGDLAEARRRYEAALAADPASLDALLGMATVEARLGNRSVAQLQYRRALEVDPRNATALAGLAALADGLPPDAVEAQLREDVARFPGSAQLRFALGSQYASQHRWGEAQAVFYEAYRLEPTGADILFNLAVSLDHMNQPRLAADFYRRAVEAAQSQPTQFDPAPVRRRIAELAAN